MKFFLKKSPHTQKIYEKMMSKFNAASALVNSFDSLASSAPTLLVFIILVTNDQLLLDFGPEMNESNDSKTVTAIDSTSLNMLTVSLLTCSFLRELKVVLFSKALRNEASVEDLNMPSNSEMRGCCLEGKLLDRTFALNINMNRADDVTKFASSTSFAFSTNGVDCALALRLYVSRH
ncbi:hypothetical protein G4B88_008632 [Cannabis sativa]|uniref:Uncharacterized protein n=1 Tax=Cannabis sativa TaxID=3483 RepID=A0A7J6FCI5_CANSA|nr:hypothetical protein G4B88_008632 [Cannabis sativa]